MPGLCWRPNVSICPLAINCYGPLTFAPAARTALHAKAPARLAGALISVFKDPPILTLVPTNYPPILEPSYPLCCFCRRRNFDIRGLVAVRLVPRFAYLFVDIPLSFDFFPFVRSKAHADDIRFRWDHHHGLRGGFTGDFSY